MDRNLRQYLPDFLREIKEFDVLMKTEQIEIEALWDTVGKVLNNGFILSSDEEGIKCWERALQIANTNDEELEDRRFRVLVRLNEQLPYTEEVLKKQLQTLCGLDGYSVKVDVENYILSVRVFVSSENRFREVKDLTERMTPANMVIDIGLSRKAEKKAVYYALTQLHRVSIKAYPDSGDRSLSYSNKISIGVPTLEYVRVSFAAQR